MKKFVVMLCLGLVSGLALAAAGSQVVAQETQIATRATPTASSFTLSSGSTIGAAVNMTDLNYFRVSVCSADSADALQAVGTLKAYRFDERGNEVVPNKLLDLDMTQQAAAHCVGFPDQRVGVPYDLVMYAASGLKLTDGGTLLTQTDGGLDAGAFIVKIRGWKVP